MKRLLIALTIVLSVLALTACGAKGEVLRVGMDLSYPPFETVTTQNEPEGISVDIANAFGKYLGRDVEIVNTDFGSLIPALNSGEIDIVIASMSITPERELSVDFSNPYFYFKIISLVNKNFADANSITEDSSKEDVLALSDVTFVGLASQVSASIPAEYGKTVIEATDIGTAVESVAQGTADILLMSANPVVDGYYAHPNDTIILWDSFESSPIGMAVAEGNKTLLDQANAFIATFNDEGGLYSVLKTKWDSTIMSELGKYGLDFYINE